MKKLLVKPHLNGKKAGHGGVSVILVNAGSVKQDCVPGGPGQKVRPYLKSNQEKKGLKAWLNW
jgi:hypothetical protein